MPNFGKRDWNIQSYFQASCFVNLVLLIRAAEISSLQLPQRTVLKDVKPTCTSLNTIIRESNAELRALLHNFRWKANAVRFRALYNLQCKNKCIAELDTPVT